MRKRKGNPKGKVQNKGKEMDRQSVLVVVDASRWRRNNLGGLQLLLEFSEEEEG